MKTIISLFLLSLTAHGQVFYCDSGSALYGGSVFKVSVGAPSLITSGNKLTQPLDITVTATGSLIVSDQGKLVRVDPATGTQSVIVQSYNVLGAPFGIACDSVGDVLAANGRSILRVNPNGKIRMVTYGGDVTLPVDVAIAEDGYLYVIDLDFPPAIVRVHPKNGNQLVVSQGGLLRSPQGIAVQGDYAFVTDIATPDGNFGSGRVLRVNIMTGTQSTLTTGGLLVGPVGITIEPDGLLVADPYVINQDSADLYDGGIVRIDPNTGQQTLIVRGAGDNVNPVGVASK